MQILMLRERACDKELFRNGKRNFYNFMLELIRARARDISGMNIRGCREFEWWLISWEEILC